METKIDRGFFNAQQAYRRMICESARQDMPIVRRRLYESIDEKTYKVYVVVKSKDGSEKIESGWLSAEDAKDRKNELKKDGIPSRSVSRRYLKSIGLDPSDDSSWFKGNVGILAKRRDESVARRYVTRARDIIESMVSEAGISIDDIMNMHKERKSIDDMKAAEQKSREEEEARSRGIKQIIINAVGSDGTIKYTIVRNDGSRTEETDEGYGTDNEEFKRMEKILRSMNGKTPDDIDVFVAMFRRSYDSASRTPIQWYYDFDKEDAIGRDDDWYYRPSEDYLGHTPDFVQSIYDAGGRVPGMR